MNAETTQLPVGKTPKDPFWRRWAKNVVGQPRNRAELLTQIAAARQAKLIEADAADMVRGVFETDELQVRDIMIPRAQMVAMEDGWTVAQVIAHAQESGHSRFPVVGETRDEIRGILLAKDLIGGNHDTSDSDTPFPFGTHLRPAVFVPESKRVNVLLRDFKRDRQHMAIVADEYGGVAGLVTIEDVLETIVGDIDDEKDTEEAAQILRLDSRRYTVQGQTPIEDFNEYFSTQFPDEDFDTVGGLVTHELGHLPRRGESVQVGPFQFNVQRADQRRVLQLQVKLP